MLGRLVVEEIISLNDSTYRDGGGDVVTQYDNSSFECGAGWENLIQNALAQLVQISPGMRVSQIKEKFGGLRLYAYPEEGISEDDYNRFYAVIRTAEDQSYTTCEDCGSREATLGSQRGYYRTTCAAHRSA